VLARSLEVFGESPTWVLSNHDLVRHTTRYGGGEQGQRRARAVTATLLGLPGSPYLYQGEELGLEQSDVPPELRQDPMYFNSGRTVPGRDGCRTPMPWTPGEGHGFTTGRPWLPFGADADERSVAAERDDPQSMLAFYRSALALRRTLRDELDREVRWLAEEPDLLGYTRSSAAGGFTCLLNTGAPRRVAVPAGSRVVLDTSGSAALDGAELALPAESAVWLRAHSG
jgi:alpha-glucosidase